MGVDEKRIIHKRWRKGWYATLLFYKQKLWVKARQFNFVSPLLPYFAPMIGDKKEVWIADLGAGMYSTTGSTWPKTTVHLYPSDVLADKFNEILKAHHVVPVIPVEKQDMENLTYPDRFFDIVHCVNALDHSADPLKALLEMYRVTKPGGWIYLRHHSDNAERRRYNGLHVWNITPKDGDCLFWNKEESFTLNQYIPGWITEVKKETEDLPEMVVSTIHKRL
jgi:SAM-dependent methyltransferase